MQKPCQAVKLIFSSDREGVDPTIIFVANPAGYSNFTGTADYEPAKTDTLYAAMDKPSPGG